MVGKGDGMEIVNKPWGYEKWLTLNSKYALKEIFMKAGYKSSLQYHKEKMETNYIMEGKGILYVGIPQEGRELSKGSIFDILPNMVHRVEAVTDLLMIEVSTPEVDDIVRLQDDFSRGNGRIESEHKR